MAHRNEQHGDDADAVQNVLQAAALHQILRMGTGLGLGLE